MPKRGAPSLHAFIKREAATTGRQSKQRVQALRDLKEWAPALWSRTEDGWGPTRYSTQPPTISPHVMAGIIRDNLVVVVTKTDRGVPVLVQLRP